MERVLSFSSWFEAKEEGEEKLPLEDSSEIPWDVWKTQKEPIEVFVYGDLIDRDKRPLEKFDPARVRGMIRVYDAPIAKKGEAGISIRRTGRVEDTVNGGITTIPAEELPSLSASYRGYSLGLVTAVRIDEKTGMPLKKSQRVFYFFNPQRAQKKLKPNKDHLRRLLKAAYDISPAFGDEFVQTTYRLPKRGSRLVKITR